MIVSRNDQDIAQKKTIKDSFVLVWFFNSPTLDSALIRKTPNKKTMCFLIKTVTGVQVVTPQSHLHFYRSEVSHNKSLMMFSVQSIYNATVKTETFTCFCWKSMANVLHSLNHEPPNTQAAASTLQHQDSSEYALWVLLGRSKSLEAPRLYFTLSGQHGSYIYFSPLFSVLKRTVDVWGGRCDRVMLSLGALALVTFLDHDSHHRTSGSFAQSKTHLLLKGQRNNDILALAPFFP